MHPHEPPPEDQEEWQEENRPAIVRPNWITRAHIVAMRHWNPKELTPPAVDPDLDRLSAIERSAEVFRHSVLSFEHWVSPKGWLREWIRFNCKIAAFLAVPAFVVVPLVTRLLRQIREWVTLVVESTSTFVMFPLSALLLVGLINALIYLGRSITSRRQQYRQQQNYYQ